MIGKFRLAVEICGSCGPPFGAGGVSNLPPRWSTVRPVSLQPVTSIRGAWSRLGALGRTAPLLAGLAAVGIAIPVLALAQTPGVGYDVSFPQCSGSGVQALPATP